MERVTRGTTAFVERGIDMVWKSFVGLLKKKINTDYSNDDGRETGAKPKRKAVKKRK